MKRAALLYCAEIELHRFKTLRQRGQLPHLTDTVQEIEAPIARYTLEDAMILRLFLDLIGQEDDKPSIGPSVAANLIGNAMGHLHTNHRHPLNADGKDLWIGVVVHHSEHTEELKRYTSWFGGTLDEVSAAVEKQENNSKDNSVRIVLVNASRAARVVRQRASDLRIPESHDFSEIWS